MVAVDANPVRGLRCPGCKEGFVPREVLALAEETGAGDRHGRSADDTLGPLVREIKGLRYNWIIPVALVGFLLCLLAIVGYFWFVFTPEMAVHPRRQVVLYGGPVFLLVLVATVHLIILGISRLPAPCLQLYENGVVYENKGKRKTFKWQAVLSVYALHPLVKINAQGWEYIAKEGKLFLTYRSRKQSEDGSPVPPAKLVIPQRYFSFAEVLEAIKEFVDPELIEEAFFMTK